MSYPNKTQVYAPNRGPAVFHASRRRLEQLHAAGEIDYRCRECWPNNCKAPQRHAFTPHLTAPEERPQRDDSAISEHEMQINAGEYGTQGWLYRKVQKKVAAFAPTAEAE